MNITSKTHDIQSKILVYLENDAFNSIIKQVHTMAIMLEIAGRIRYSFLDAIPELSSIIGQELSEYYVNGRLA